jgi:ATP-dependent Zn protease
MSDERAAIHEAGHAVTAAVLGLDFALVRLSPPRLEWGREAFGKHVSHAEALALAVTTLAGAAALELVTGERHTCADCSDLRQARKVLSEVRDGPTLEAAYAMALSMLHSARAALERVTNELLAKGWVPYSRVKELAQL